MNMQDYNVLNDDGGIEIPELYAIATSTDTDHDKRLIAVQEFIQEQTNDSYCHLASSRVGLPCSMLNFDRSGFLVCTSPINCSVKAFISTSL